MSESQTAYTYGDNRFWEAVPGVLVWGTLFFAIGLSFISPIWAIVFIIVFDLYWLLRVVYYVIFLVISWYRYRTTVRVNWQAKLSEIPKSKEIYHLIFLPTYKEGYEIIQTTLNSLKQNTFPNQKMMIVLAGEEGDKEHFLDNAKKAKAEFGSIFKDMFVTVHPKGLPNEIPGKGSNLNWAGHRVEEWLSEAYPDLADENIVVSAFDVDTIADPQYFSYLTYLYCTVENPTRSSYQPVALYSNNIWEAKAPVRVAAFGTVFWLMAELTRADRLWTFSSHSMPWKMLRDVRFWQKDIVSEDSRIFMQGFIHYHGDYRVTPMHLSVSMDTVVGASYFEAMVNLYKQLRRWAWGVEHLPVIVREFKRDKLMPIGKKVKYLFNHIEGMYTWATAPVLIFIMGWLPLALATRSEVIVHVAPTTLEWLMRFAAIGIFTSGALALLMLPPRPKHVKARSWLVMVLQWGLLPITFIIFGSFPAIDAQTRLMLGKYLGFNVTKKTR